MAKKRGRLGMDVEMAEDLAQVGILHEIDHGRVTAGHEYADVVRPILPRSPNGSSGGSGGPGLEAAKSMASRSFASLLPNGWQRATAGRPRAVALRCRQDDLVAGIDGLPGGNGKLVEIVAYRYRLAGLQLERVDAGRDDEIVPRAFMELSVVVTKIQFRPNGEGYRMRPIFRLSPGSNEALGGALTKLAP